MRVIAVLVLSLVLATAAQAGPALFQASFIMHAFGEKITPWTTARSFIALPLGRLCGGTAGMTWPPYCTPAELTQGAPATGSGTISMGTGLGASFALPQSALGIITSGSLPAHTPYLLRQTYATFVNEGGSFYAGGGAAAGLGSKTKIGVGPTAGTWRIVEGPNGFGGALGILGQFGARQEFVVLSTFEGTSNWNMTQALGRTPYATQIGTGPMGTPLYQNPYYNTGMFTSVTPMGYSYYFTISERGSGTLWTTGWVAMYATTPGGYPTVLQRVGYDTVTPGGIRFLRLVTPSLAHWYSPLSGTQHTGHFGLLNIRLIPDADADGDTVTDADDNCKDVPNAGSLFCDTDMDGYGNACDADLNNDGVVGPAEFVTSFAPVFASTGVSDADLNCDLIVGGPDYAIFGQSLYGAPGPSGLACAGTAPCP
jgi:hypothetical protein